MSHDDARAGQEKQTAKKGPRRPNLRQEYQILTRRRLLDSALRVFEKQGYNSATVEAIISTAGVVRSTFYLHFKNKMEIVTFLTEEIRPSVQELYDGLDKSIIEDGPDTREVVQRWLRDAIAWYDEPQHRIMALVWQELSVESDSMVMRGISVDEHMPRYLAQWPPRLRDSARARVILLSHLLSRAYFLSQRHVLPINEDAMIDSLADIWATGLFPPSKARLPRGE